VRRSLIDALLACVENSSKPKTRRFLLGLSFDELQFIAGFLGSCTLNSPLDARGSCSARCSEDQDLKLIVLREYLSQSGLARFTQPLRAAAGGN